jgi:uncharacterized SAM-binding protein YcdF (DUF218 family)
MKELVNPFLWFLIVLFVSLTSILLGKAAARAKLVWGLLVLTFMITLLSIPVASSYFEKILWVADEQGFMTKPDYIVVLGGGYEAGRTLEDDLLVIDSQKRVLMGISVWKEHPDSVLVFSGGSSKEGRSKERMAQLASIMAIDRGVSAESMLLEIESINTAAHPVELIKKTQINKESHLVIVTNRWHMKRALREFCKYFSQVTAVPVESSGQDLTWMSFIPDADSLEDSTTYIREWAGLIWYRMNDWSRLGTDFQC